VLDGLRPRLGLRGRPLAPGGRNGHGLEESSRARGRGWRPREAGPAFWSADVAAGDRGAGGTLVGTTPEKRVMLLAAGPSAPCALASSPDPGGRAARPAACRTEGAAHNRQETPRGSLAVVWRSPVRVGAPTVWVTTQAGACRAGLASQRDRGGEQKSCMGEPWGNAGTRDGPGKIWGDSGVPLGAVAWLP
jgi:hypothetical protein